MTRSANIDGPAGAMHRRAFMAKATLTLAGAAAASMLPMTGLTAATANMRVTAAVTPSAPDGVWHMDHIFGHVPPYSHPIGYGRQRADADVDLAGVHPADLNFVA